MGVDREIERQRDRERDREREIQGWREIVYSFPKFEKEEGGRKPKGEGAGKEKKLETNKDSVRFPRSGSDARVSVCRRILLTMKLT